jgi:hypothetical protein
MAINPEYSDIARTTVLVGCTSRSGRFGAEEEIASNGIHVHATEGLACWIGGLIPLDCKRANGLRLVVRLNRRSSNDTQDEVDKAK